MKSLFISSMAVASHAAVFGGAVFCPPAILFIGVPCMAAGLIAAASEV